jgi:enoyl-CoA hydratase/carnithine racemase
MTAEVLIDISDGVRMGILTGARDNVFAGMDLQGFLQIARRL